MPTVATALRGMAPAGLGCGVHALDGPVPELWRGEAAAVARAVPSRRREFAGGRAAARAAMMAAGLPPAALPAGPDRVPVWPEGMTGSIAHAGGLAVAVVGAAAEWAGLGIDLEPAGSVTADLAASILSTDEAQVGAGVADWPTRVFCAKEAVQKAIWGRARTLLDFPDVAVTATSSGFRARLTRGSGPLPAGLELSGQWATAGGYVLALVPWPAQAARISAPSFAASTAAS